MFTFKSVCALRVCGCVKATFPALPRTRGQNGSISEALQALEIKHVKPPLTRVIVDSTGIYEASSDYGTSVNTQDGPLYSVNCCNLRELSWSAAFWS